MATTSKQLFRATSTTNTTTVLYTVPASTTTVVTNMAICNPTGVAATFTLAMGTSSMGGQVYLHVATPIAANTTVYIDLKQVLSATDQITGGSSSGSVTFHISGVEIN